MKTIIITLDTENDSVHIDRATVPIDDSEPRALALRRALESYIQSARRAPRGAGYRLVQVPEAQIASRDIRAWWKENPIGLPPWRVRGRLPGVVVRAYQEAHAGTPPRARGVRTFDALGRAALLAEARASVALDGDTQCVEGRAS